MLLPRCGCHRGAASSHDVEERSLGPSMTVCIRGSFHGSGPSCPAPVKEQWWCSSTLSRESKNQTLFIPTYITNFQERDRIWQLRSQRRLCSGQSTRSTASCLGSSPPAQPMPCPHTGLHYWSHARTREGGRAKLCASSSPFAEASHFIANPSPTPPVRRLGHFLPPPQRVW